MKMQVLTLVLELRSAATSTAGAGTTDTCHGPFVGSSDAVVLGRVEGGKRENRTEEHQ